MQPTTGVVVVMIWKQHQSIVLCYAQSLSIYYYGIVDMETYYTFMYIYF